MNKKKIKAFIICLILIVLVAVYLYFENTVIQITEIDIIDTEIPTSFDGYKIVHISDLHNAEFGRKNEKLLGKIQSLSPEVIFITGDIIDSNKTDIGAALDFVESVVKFAPVYYVPGNHEAWISTYDELVEGLLNAGVTILNNTYVPLEQGSETINLAGLKAPNFSNSSSDSDTILESYLREMSLDTSRFTILLSHRPEAFDMYVSEGINLIFSGHAHGGQFRIPLLGAIVAPDQGLFPAYTSGVYKQGKTSMVVSRGLGNSVIPFRINNRPEIVVVTLNRSEY